MPAATLLLLDAPPPMPDPVLPLTIVAGRVRRYAAGETLAAALLPGALPGLAGAAYPAGTLLGGAGTGLPAALALGAGLTLAGGTLSAAGGGGGGGGGGSGANDPTNLGLYGWAEGDRPAVLGTAGHAEGRQAAVTDDYCHAEGYQCVAGVPAFAATVAGTTLTLAGDATGWLGDGADVVLWGLSGGTGPATATGTVAGDPAYDAGADATTLTLAEAVTTHAAGRAAVGGYGSWGAHAEGFRAVASSWTAHAEGTRTAAAGMMAHAEGDSTSAAGNATHAEGTGTVAAGYAAHAEGGGAAAAGTMAHAEGTGTSAGGMAAHAEGWGTSAAGDAAHAEGIGTAAAGYAAHAEGSGAAADRHAQHAHAAGAHAAAGDTQYARLVLAAAPADATPTPLLNGDGTPAAVRVNAIYAFRLLVLGKVAAPGSAVAAAFQRQGLVGRVGGTTTLLGTPAVVGADLNDPGWGLAVAADAVAGALTITVAGAAGAATRWVAVLETLELVS